MSNYLLSKQMSIVIDGSTLGCATDFSLSVNKDIIEIACMTSSSKEKIPDLYNWSISFSGMVIKTTAKAAGTTGIEDLMSSIMSDASVSVYVLPDVASNKYWSGGGYLASVSMDGGTGAGVTFSGEISGDGALTEQTASA